MVHTGQLGSNERPSSSCTTVQNAQHGSRQQESSCAIGERERALGASNVSSSSLVAAQEQQQQHTAAAPHVMIDVINDDFKLEFKFESGSSIISQNLVQQWCSHDQSTTVV